MKIIDLTHAMTNEMPVMAGITPPEFRDLADVATDGYAMSQYTFINHTGTHVDAPAHQIAGGASLDDIPLDRLVTDALTIDLTGHDPGPVGPAGCMATRSVIPPMPGLRLPGYGDKRGRGTDAAESGAQSCRRRAPCSDGDTMKAIRYYRYGSPDVLEFEDIGMPAVGDDDVLVRVRAASVNPLDWHFMRGAPYLVRLVAGLSRPRAGASRLGADMAGSVEAVGKNVTEFHPGDEVFGGLDDRGTLAEYISIRHDAAVLTKPAGLTVEQAASVPVAAVTALQALRDRGQIRPGQQVLVNGASGGVGTFAVQIAKAFGAQVTGVCSTPNVEMVASIGADRVIDYTREDFTGAGRRYDLLIDIAGNRTLAETRRALVPKGVLVGVGGPNRGRWIGPLGRSVRMALVSPAVSQRMVFFLARQNKADLAVLRELLEAGKIIPVIDRTYPLAEVAAAIRYLEEGHARGKVAITM